jgi:NTE family protein
MSRRILERPAKVGWACALACAATLFALDAAAQETAATRLDKRPRVALALAGGGARGGAHVGVLKVLEELRVPIDCIAGTSMGSLVGGGYASGMPAKDIEQFVRKVDWKSVVGGVGARELEPVEQKRFNDSSGSLELGVKNGRVITPSGLISTSRIEDVLRTYVARARAVPNFDMLPIPFRAVATDMLTGNMVVLDHGDIAMAMRASMAIPGAFAPVITEQYALADGFVVRNLPIDVARNLCGDVVIAVNLVKPPVTREQLVGLGALVSRSYDVMSEANERLQLDTLTDKDVRIDVDLGKISASDFERTPETIELGEKAARAMATRLSALSVSEADYAEWRRRVTVSQGIETKIAEVRFEGLKRINPEYLRSVTSIQPGDRVDIEAISHDAASMAALDDLEGVEYRLSGDPANPTLTWEPKEKEIGPNYLRPSVGLYGAGGGELQFELDLQYVRRWLNSYGAQWRNSIEFGTRTRLDTSLYQPLDVAQVFFVEPIAQIGRSLEYIYNDYSRIAQYRFIDVGGRLDFGVNFGRTAQVRLGYFGDRQRTEVDTGLALLPQGQHTDAGLAATALYDSRDSASFATRGLAAEVQYFKSDAALGADRNFERLEGAAREVIHISKVTLWVTAAAGSELGSNLPADRAFSLGGPQSFPGYAPGEVRARSYWSLESDILWRVADIVPIANQALYGGFSLQGGRVFDRVDPVPDGTLYGVSGYIGGRTPIGTLTIGVGKATSSWSMWVTLGTPVGSGSILNQPLFR